MRSNFGLTPEQKLDARSALAKLAGTGTTLSACVDFYLQGKRPLKRMFVQEVGDLFLRSRITDGCRRATVDWYDEHLRYIVGAFGHKLIDEVSRADFRHWFTHELNHKPASMAATARCARALWRWSIRHDPPLAVADVTVGLKFAVKPQTDEGSKKFLPVEKCQLILNNIAPEHVSAVALLLFAGIRPDEIAGEGKEWLLWRHIDTEGRTIRVPHNIAKVGQGRLIEKIPDTVWYFLKPGLPDETVSSIQRRALIDNIQKAGGFAPGAWPQDALRHTCATYAVADLTDITFVSHWLGNSVPVLRRNYVGIVKKAVAAAFWALRPK